VTLYRLPIFKSAVPVDTSHPSHFVAPEMIQSSLKKVCLAWVDYLQDFVDQTTKLFEAPELPWLCNERAMVSSLAAAIIRHFPNSIVVEECRVPRVRKAPWGRCDLWASIPDRSHAGGRFNFYLEAKKSNFEITPDTLLDFLKSRWGMGRLIRTYTKNHAKPRSRLSAYIDLTGRVHEHYVIGMLVTRLTAGKNVSATVRRNLHQFFENRQTIEVRWKRINGVITRGKRNLGRFPTAVVAVLPDDGNPGMLAIFTVFGSTRELLVK
jgi:hypothetical protein